jgi:DNA repair protein SbcD/Mre11
MHRIHIADTHQGLAAFNSLDPETGTDLREKQVYDNFLSAIDVIIQQKPDLLVHAGDLFDTVKPKTRAYTTVLEALDRFHAAGIPFIVIAGNHRMVKTRYTTSSYDTLTPPRSFPQPRTNPGNHNGHTPYMTAGPGTPPSTPPGSSR